MTLYYYFLVYKTSYDLLLAIVQYSIGQDLKKR